MAEHVRKEIMVMAATERDPSRGKFELDNVLKDFGAQAWDAMKGDVGQVFSDIADGWNTHVAEPFMKNIGEPVMGAVDTTLDFGNGVLHALGNGWKNFCNDVKEGSEASRQRREERRQGISTPAVETPTAGDPEFC